MENTNMNAAANTPFDPTKDKLTVGLGEASLTDDQREFIGSLVKQYGHQFIDLIANEVDAEKPIEKCHALIGNIQDDLLKTAKVLQWLQVAPAGVERYMKPDVLPNDDVVLTNGSGAYGTTIAEYMLGGLLMLQRRMVGYLDNQRKHVWKKDPGIRTIYGSKITVVGVGDLGTSFAQRCKALGAEVTGVRKSQSTEADPCYARIINVGMLDEALADADVVALCLPQTDETTKLLDADKFAKMPKGAIVINVGRGTAIDTPALIDALKSGHLGGALLDVTDPEPLPEDSELWDAPNLVLTPHISGLDRDKLAAGFVFDIFKQNVQNFLEGKPLMNVVDRNRGY